MGRLQLPSNKFYIDIGNDKHQEGYYLPLGLKMGMRNQIDEKLRDTIQIGLPHLMCRTNFSFNKYPLDLLIFSSKVVLDRVSHYALDICGSEKLVIPVLKRP